MTVKMKASVDRAVVCDNIDVVGRVVVCDKNTTVCQGCVA